MAARKTTTKKSTKSAPKGKRAAQPQPEVGRMISYAPLWETMKRKNATTYTLQVKGEISSSTVRRLKANESVSTNTLDALCRILDCELDDIIAYLPDETE